MTKYLNQYRIESNRLPYLDYTSPGYYFVTFCTKNREKYFGDIINKRMRFTKIGSIARKLWLDIPKHFNNVSLDEYSILPNHIHGIIIINNRVTCSSVETQHAASLLPGSLSAIIRSYKSAVTKFSNENNLLFSWQSRFWDHVIRNENKLFSIRKYIQNNISKWHLDEYYK